MKYLLASEFTVPCPQQGGAGAPGSGKGRPLIAGRSLYHGPRNPLPEGYNPLAVSEALNALSVKPLCVRGTAIRKMDIWYEFPGYGGTIQAAL